jgi:hypothetical protein
MIVKYRRTTNFKFLHADFFILKLEEFSRWADIHGGSWDAYILYIENINKFAFNAV